MKDNLSNHLKAFLFLEDITEKIPVRREKGFTVQHFNYECYRTRDSEGIPYGSSNTSIMELTLKSLSGNGCKELYERLRRNTLQLYSIVFNATFDSSMLLDAYEDGMIVSGYPIEIEELFGEKETKTPSGMYLTMKLLIHSITYIGKISNKTLFINQ